VWAWPFKNPVLLPWRTTLENVLLPLEVVEPYKRTFKQNLAQHEKSALELLAHRRLGGFSESLSLAAFWGNAAAGFPVPRFDPSAGAVVVGRTFCRFGCLYHREDMWEMLQRLWLRTGCTAILITHDLRGGGFPLRYHLCDGATA
jgi:NitT/TauT family transport system ATP-binding protein